MLGYPPAELLGLNAFRYMFPGDLERGARLLEECTRSPGAPVEAQFLYLHKSGGWHAIEATAVNHLADPAIRAIVATFRDVSVRRRGEEALAELGTIVSSSSDAILAKDMDGVIKSWNAAAEQLYGWTAAEIIGRHVSILAPPDAPDEIPEIMAKIRRGERLQAYETVRVKKDGTRIHVSLSVSPIRDARGNLTGGSSIARDITERVGRDEQRRQTQRLEAIGTLAGGVAHDFNNILTAITSFAELLLLDLGADDPRRPLAEELRAAADRGAALTGQLLAFGRRQVLAPRVLDLNALIAQLGKMLRRLIGEDVKLVTRLAPALGAVRADPGGVEQALLNLAVNARDAMPRGGELAIATANVELDASYAAEHASVVPGRYVMVAVSDTGTGMDAQTVARIFEPFFTTKAKGEGTGLGLATVYGIVKQSGGHVWVSSEPGRGTTFKIHLPRVDEPVEPVAPPAASTAPAAGGRETILLAEDDPAVREASTQALARLGYRVLAAADPHAALRLARMHAEPIHLLVTDVVMPGMNGRQLAKSAAALRPGLKVLFLSGYSDDEIVRRGVLEQHLTYLQKPFGPHALAAKVRSLLDQPL